MNTKKMINDFVSYLTSAVPSNALRERINKTNEVAVAAIPAGEPGTFEVTDELVDRLMNELGANGVNREEFKKGLQDEQEHIKTLTSEGGVSDPIVTVAKLALDHLKELPDYYTKLAAMEKGDDIGEAVIPGQPAEVFANLDDVDEIEGLLAKQPTYKKGEALAIVYPYQHKEWDKIDTMAAGKEETNEVKGLLWILSGVEGTQIFKLYVNVDSDLIAPAYIVQDPALISELQESVKEANELSKEQRAFLDKHRGQDLIRSVHAFKQEFGLDDKEGDRLVTLWTNEPATNEATPPGEEYIVKGIKKSHKKVNPWAIAWSMRNKGARFHKGPNAGHLMKDAEAASEDIAAADQFKILARGIVNKDDADRVAQSKQGSVVSDEKDPKKFMVIVKESRTNESYFSDITVSINDLIKQGKNDEEIVTDITAKYPMLDAAAARSCVNVQRKNENTNEAQFGSLAWRIEQIDKATQLLAAGKPLTPDLMAFVECDAEHNRMTPAEYTMELKKIAATKESAFQGMPMTPKEVGVTDMDEDGDYDVCDMCKQKKHKSDMQVFKSPPLYSLCGRCANDISLNPNSYEKERTKYKMHNTSSGDKDVGVGERRIDEAATKAAIKVEEPDASDELIDQIFARQVSMGTKIIYIDTKDGDEQKTLLDKPVADQKPGEQKPAKENKVAECDDTREYKVNEVRFVIMDLIHNKVKTKNNGDFLDFASMADARSHITKVLGEPHRYEILARTNTSGMMAPPELVGIGSEAIIKKAQGLGVIKEELTPEQNAVIDGLAQDVKPYVDKIEARPATTKGHYGDYMALLSQFQKDKVIMMAMAMACKRAGADIEGVNWALKMMTGSAFEANEGIDIEARIKEIEDYLAGKKKDIVVGHGFANVDDELKSLKQAYVDKYGLPHDGKDPTGSFKRYGLPPTKESKYVIWDSKECKLLGEGGAGKDMTFPSEEAATQYITSKLGKEENRYKIKHIPERRQMTEGKSYTNVDKEQFIAALRNPKIEWEVISATNVKLFQDPIAALKQMTNFMLEDDGNTMIADNGKMGTGAGEFVEFEIKK